jgi:hypothetical protein
MQKFLEKNSFWFSTIIALGVAVYMIVNWGAMPETQRLVGLYFIAISLHEWEEMRFPGGFVDMVMNGIGLKLRNTGVAKLALFIVEMFVAFVPLFFPDVIWMCAAPLLLGCIETIAHLAATRISTSKFYSPGMGSAIIIMLPVSIYGIVYIAGNDLMKPVYWLYSALYLLVPVLIAQASIVKSNGMKYGEFLGNARSALFGKGKVDK